MADRPALKAASDGPSSGRAVDRPRADDDPTETRSDPRPSPTHGVRPPPATPTGRPGEHPAAPHAAPSPAAPRRFAGWWLAGSSWSPGSAVRFLYLFGWRTPWTGARRPVLLPPRRQPARRRRGLRPPVPVLLFGAVRMPGADHPPGYMTVLAGFSWLGLRSFLPAPGDRRACWAAPASPPWASPGAASPASGSGSSWPVLAALSPNVFYFDAMVVSETMMVATTASILLAAYRWWDRPTVRSAARLRRWSIGVAALVRSESILLGPLIAVPLVWWRVRRARRRPPPRRRVGPARGWRLVAPARGGAASWRPSSSAPWVGVQHVPLRGADHAVGPVRPDARHGQLRRGLLRRPGRLLVAVLHPGDRAPGRPTATPRPRAGGSRASPASTSATTPSGCRTWWRPGWGARSACTSPRSRCFARHLVDQKEPCSGRSGMFAWYGIGRRRAPSG